MKQTPTMEELWNSTPPGKHKFDPDRLRNLPDRARRYLEKSIEPGTILANAVRLKMHGEIRLNRWLPFHAEQVISWERGMIWRATVRMYGISISGSDSWVAGQGSMRWRLLGVVPLVTASGQDITRSAAGRVNIESIWLPSVLCDERIAWSDAQDGYLHARFTAHGEAADIEYTVDGEGGLGSVNMPRWGNPEGAGFHFANCGGVAEELGRFGGYTIPVSLRVGWHSGADRFESEGEFFRVTVDDAVYR